MTCELPDIVRFIADHPPFLHQNAAGIEGLAASADVMFVPAGQEILATGVANAHLYQVRKGSVELFEGGRILSARLDEGSFFAYPSLLRQNPVRNAVRAAEDSLIYRYEGAAFQALLQQNDHARQFFQTAEADRLRAALGKAVASNQMQLNGSSAPATDNLVAETPLADLIGRPPVTCLGHQSVQDVAQLMAREDVSTVLVTSAGGALEGIVSDKDLRRKVVACALDLSAPVADIMTPNPISFDQDTPVLEALMVMMDRHFRHAPVMDNKGTLIGLVSGTDMMHRMATSGLQLARAIGRAHSEDELVSFAKHQSRMLQDLMNMGLAADRVAALVSSTGLAIHRRAYELAIAELGEPPVGVAFLCFGSLARREQTGVSDQDNGFILDDSYCADQHGAYFARLATRISDCLDACGYVYCGGDIMATNDKWRQPLATWISYFRQWITVPDPKALMHASIFFDRAFVAGDRALLGRLNEGVTPLTQGAGIFLAHLTENALSSKPPLGFFRQFVVAQHGEEAHSFDIKKEGLVPLQDLIRVHALAHGVDAVGTLDRIKALKAMKAMAGEDLDELADAFRFMMAVRLTHQAEQMSAGKHPSNFIDPEHLSRFDREHLRAAFKLVSVHQQGLSRATSGGVY